LEPEQHSGADADAPRGDIVSVLFAGMMAFLLPGYGQLYNGRWNKALWLFLVFCASALFVVALASLLVPERYLMPALAAGVCATVGSWAFGIVDAMWQAWRAPLPVRSWQTVPVYFAALLFAYLVVFKAGGGYVRANIVESYRIPSQSMAPGILRGDFLFADKRVNCPGCRRSPRHGDVALFIYPDNRNMVFIKRIVGLPGDTIEIRGTEVFRNGRSLAVRTTDRPGGRVEVVERGAAGVYEVEWQGGSSEELSFEVPSGKVFMMGDNRNHSQDSRRFGAVPLADVIGIARQVWLSVDDRFNIRWERMGRPVQ